MRDLPRGILLALILPLAAAAAGVSAAGLPAVNLLRKGDDARKRGDRHLAVSIYAAAILASKDNESRETPLAYFRGGELVSADNKGNEESQRAALRDITEAVRVDPDLVEAQMWLGWAFAS